MGKQDPVSLSALDHITVRLTYVGRELDVFARLGEIMPSLMD